VASKVAAVDTLHLDDAGPEVRKVTRGQRRRDRLLDGNDSDAFKSPHLITLGAGGSRPPRSVIAVRDARYGCAAALGLGGSVAPADGLALGDAVAPGGLVAPELGVGLADALGLGVAVGEAALVGVAEGAGVDVVLGVGDGDGLFPEPELAGNAVRRWLVDAWIAVRTAIAMAKISTQRPATATHLRRTTGKPARRLLHRSRLQPLGADGAAGSLACSPPSAGNGSSGSVTPVAGVT
jgi:hypothetical protein